MAEFFAMGGYAGFVWPAYLLTGAVLAGLLWTSLGGLRSAKRRLDLMERPSRMERRK